MMKPYRRLLFAAVAPCAVFCCSWLGENGTLAPARKVAEGARVVAVETARAGALVGRAVASGTYRGSRRAVTWTGAHTREGTAATLEMLNLIERPVPPDILEKLPEEILEQLTMLEFVRPVHDPGKVVVASRDSRWEGEVFYSLDSGDSFEIEILGPDELIVVSLAAFDPAVDGKNERATYTVEISEDNRKLGEVSFESWQAPGIHLYGHRGWRLSSPGVFVVNALDGWHTYSLSCKRDGSGTFVLLSCFLPHYGER